MAFRGKSVWIHDISQELPAALALELARLGNYVLASGRDEVTLRRLIERGRGAIDGFTLDLSDHGSRLEAADRLAVMTDRLDLTICQSTPYAGPILHPVQGESMQQLTEHLFTNVVHFVDLAMPLQRRVAKPQLLVINPMQRSAPHRSHPYRAPEAALEAFVRSLSKEDPYRRHLANLVVLQAAASNPLATAASAKPLARQIIDSMEQTRFPIYIPPKPGRMRRMLAWRPAGWYRSRHKLTASAKGG